jgi:hypothetical protein
MVFPFTSHVILQKDSRQEKDGILQSKANNKKSKNPAGSIAGTPDHPA